MMHWWEAVLWAARTCSFAAYRRSRPPLPRVVRLCGSSCPGHRTYSLPPSRGRLRSLITTSSVVPHAYRRPAGAEEPHQALERGLLEPPVRHELRPLRIDGFKMCASGAREHRPCGCYRHARLPLGGQDRGRERLQGRAGRCRRALCQGSGPHGVLLQGPCRYGGGAPG